MIIEYILYYKIASGEWRKRVFDNASLMIKFALCYDEYRLKRRITTSIGIYEEGMF